MWTRKTYQLFDRHSLERQGKVEGGDAELAHFLKGHDKLLLLDLDAIDTSASDGEIGTRF